jgi:DNA replication and repair protein RecF
MNVIIWDMVGLKKLGLKNFRNYKKADFVFNREVAILGDNGSGKSNLLEAIYMLATGKSYRADMDAEMIGYGEKVANVKGKIENAKVEETELEIILTDGTLDAARKKFGVNGISRRMSDFGGQLRAVLFGPRDMELVTGSPGGRRRYLDFVISQANREYRRDLVSYEKGLRQRNKLLELIREGLAIRSQLYFWDKLLIKNGEYITRMRAEYLEKMSNVKFFPRSGIPYGGTTYNAIYDKSVISEQRLLQYETEEVAAGVTLVGPHRDDFKVNMEDRDVGKYASRGEQRMAVLWLKEGELKYLSIDDEIPVLLLDDIFSELDHQHRKRVTEILERQSKKGGQVIMTTADKHMMPTGNDWNIISL